MFNANVEPHHNFRDEAISERPCAYSRIWHEISGFSRSQGFLKLAAKKNPSGKSSRKGKKKRAPESRDRAAKAAKSLSRSAR
jgi:hypothetical protein